MLLHQVRGAPLAPERRPSARFCGCAVRCYVQALSAEVPMPKIESVSVCIARVALDNVTSFATRTVSARDYCLVKVRSSDGVEGIGFCYAGSTGGNISQGAGGRLR